MSNSVGIYFGPKIISIVESKGLKAIKSVLVPQSAVSAGDLEEKVPAESKSSAIVSILKEELKRSGIQAKEACLCLSGKDLIIRSFEIPVMPKAELPGAVNFEVKKYIPFKVEELISDFQVKYDRASSANTVLFVGVKKETLDRYLSITKQMDIKISKIEYSAFSLLRCLRLARASNKGVVATIGLDLDGEDEVNFTVLEDGFPLFSRDIALFSGPEELGRAKDSGNTDNLDKLKNELRISLDYYMRKFTRKNIKQSYLISNRDYVADLEALIKESGSSLKYLDVARYLDPQASHSLSFIKGFSASLFKTAKTQININLLEAKEKARQIKEKTSIIRPVSLFENLVIDYRVVALGALLCLLTFGWGFYRIYPFQKELENIISLRPKVISVNPQDSYENLSGKDSEYKNKLEALDELVKRQLYLTPPLNVIPRIIPGGVWLTGFSFKNENGNTGSLTFQGTCYLADNDKEFLTVNKVVSDLKENVDFNKYFKEVSLVSIERKQFRDLTATNFTIRCRTGK